MSARQWTAYTIKVIDPESPFFGELGRWKDRDGALVFIRFPGGEGGWFTEDQIEDTEKVSHPD